LVKDAQAWVSKQIDRARVADTDYEKGVLNPKANPITQAIAKKEKWANAVRDAISRDQFAKSLSGVSLQDWQGRASTVGKERYARGVESARPKIEKFVNNFRPILMSIQSSIQAEPDTSADQRKKRMTDNLDKLRAAKGTWRK